MDNKKLIIVSILGLSSIMVYLYFKNKSTAIKIENDKADVIEKQKQSEISSLGVPSVTNENIQKALFALNIDQTKSITELASPNYIEAKKIANNMKEINSIVKTASIKYKGYKDPMAGVNKELISNLSGEKISTYGNGWFKPSIPQLLENMTKKINELGYKVLPSFEVEKI